MAYKNTFRLIYTLLLTALLAGGNMRAMAQSSTGVVVHGNVYGGGNQADVEINTEVNISTGTVEGNVYGGGNLGDVGKINDKSDKANYIWTGTDNQPNSSGGANNTGVCSVHITGSTVLIGPAGENSTADKDHGNVFGGGKGNDNSGFYCEEGMVYSTSVEITAGTVKGTVFGGGEVGRVEDNTIVTIGEDGADGNTNTPVINGDVFGAGKGLKTHGYSALVRGNPVVTVQGKTLVGGSVYGGGEIASVGKHKVKTSNDPLTPGDAPADLPVGMPYTLANTNLGKCTVTIKDNVTITNNVFGAGQGVNDYAYSNTFRRMGMSGWDAPFADADAYHVFLQTLALATDTHVTIEGNANVNGSVFGGSESGFVQYDTNVTIKGGVISTDVYGGGRGLTDNIIAGRVNGNINVNILGGTITRDVYGGAALAKSNAKSTTTPGDDPVTTYPTTTVNLLGGTIGRDAYGGGLGNANTAADVGNTKVNLNGMALSEFDNLPAGDFKTSLGDILTAHDTNDDEDTSDEGVDYYIADQAKGCIVNRIFGANNVNGTPVGDVAVHVYATQNSLTSKTNVGDKIAKDDVNLNKGQSEEDDDYLARLKDILRDKKAIALAFNDIDVSSYDDSFFEGTTASTFKTAIETLTTALDAKAATEEGLTAINAVRYDVDAVYGGGNEAAYVPTSAWNGTTGSKSQVIIDGCDYTSIEYVYGGGNAAAVPETNVTVNAAYEIYYVFGGGNGKDQLANGDPNPGADVGVHNSEIYGTGNATTRLIGGTIHEAYGASNTKGNIKGTVDIDTGTDGYCTLNLGKMVGAGKNADIDGGVNLVLGCKPAAKILEIYGGADNANVNGSINLTITSGNYGKVFGGNNLGGIIKGSITLNIEETGECDTPITIDELYLGGNKAAYSVYYDDDGNPLTLDAFNTAYTTEVAREAHKYADPILNVISCTHIGQVFGGGLGSDAIMYGNPTVNINMIPGSKAGSALGGSDKLGTIGDVFGGGNEAKVVGNTTINIGTETKIDYMNTAPAHLGAEGTAYRYNSTTNKYYDITVSGANITGNVYGGGNLANVTGNTFVNICAKKGSGHSYAPVAEGAQKVTIGGNVFGGGKGIADNFYCNKAMVGEDGKGSPDNLGTNYHDGNTSVIIGNGTVGTLDTNDILVEGTGNVYGGGEVGRVEMNTTVTVGLPGEETSSPDIKGDVFGGGMGEKEHGYAGLVRGNPTVTIQANAKVEHSVYGGGEIASVARYKVPITDEDVTAAHNAGYPDAVKGRPYALKDVNSGFCTVTVQGNAIIGPDTPMKMYHEVNGAIPATDTPDDAGHVFGAGKGFMPENYDYASNTVEHKPRCRANDDSWTWFNDVDEYIAFIQTQALSSQTTVTIGDADDSDSKPFIKGSVYGGSENGLVQFDTHVYIIGGQIGCGKNANGQPHPDAIWDPDFEPDGTEDYECASWAYGKEEGSGDDKTTVYAPYDPFANASGNVDKYPKVPSQSEAKSTEGGRKVASDGHTYYGNVFGGGSGSVPYFDTKEGISKYLHSAGTVKGNTNVTISGGHILTSVYGGCEATNVMETANVTMTGGTIGVPRTDTQILAHPVTCNLYGAGKGDQRVFFNKDTNVNDAVVEVSGGRIYGSVFGGGEDGHIMRNSTVTISGADTKIGTKGTSYMDGNVFGGGRGFGGDALTAGNVGGAVTLNIENGYVLGSVYGGGRLASVGYGLYLTTETGYGVMRDDDEWDDSSKPISTTQTAAQFFDKGRGKITINISGGTIGNDVANAEYGGNVFGGSMGSLTKQDGTINTQWDKFATAKMTTVNITGGTIKRSVYGGGELGTVTTDAVVTVSGGIIGKPKDGTTVYGGAVYGNVYGGGKGYVDPDGSNYITAGIIKGNTYVTIENGSITVNETTTTTTPTIYHNIYGGGAYGSVGEFTYDGTTGMPTARKANTTGGTANITITGGTIGTDGQNNGMVFGSSRGDVGAPGEIHDKLAWVYDTHVTIGETSGSTSTLLIKGSVYGSGENGHTFNDAEVVVHSGTIGIASGSEVNGLSGSDYPYRGNVYGSGCGTDKYYSYTPIPEDHTATDGEGDRYNPLAGIVQGNTAITIDGGHVVRNVYGGGAMGSVGTLTNDLDPTTHMVDDKYKNTNAESSFALSWPYKLEYAEGTGKATITISGSARIGNEGDDDGNVYGAARGAVKVGRNSDVTIDNQRYVEALLANVRETEVKVNYETTVTSTSGTSACITGSVFGGGEDGHVYENAKIEITGGLIGHSVYGGGKGKSTFDGKLLYVTKPNSVTADDYDAEIHSWTAGRVFGNTEVLMSGGHVMRNIYGGGNLASVGKGNYAGGTDDYYPAGYGEKIGSALSDDTDFMGSGKAKVQITGQSIVGTPDNATEGTVVLSDGTTEVGFPTGNVFGSSRGQAAQDVGPRSPRYKYAPDFFLGYANETEVIIGTTGNASDYPRIYGSVYGGGRDGHVRRKTDVTIYNGKIGFEFTTANQATLGPNDASNVQWKERGNVFGSGSGLGSLVVNETNTHGTSSGSVTDFTTITIKGGTICQNVYGGGALSSVGPPRLPVDRTDEPLKTQTLCQVNIEGGAIGTAAGYTAGYGGNVYGAGRGGGLFSVDNEERYATSGWTEVNMKNGTVNGNVFGGGQAGLVKCGVDVSMTGGDVMHDLYGGGALADTQTSNWNANGDGYVLVDGLTAGVSVVTGLYTKSSGSYTEITTADTKAAADAHYYNKVGAWADGKTSASSTTHVSLTGGRIYGDAYGGGLGEIGTTSNPIGNPAYVYGDVKVELNGKTTNGTLTQVAPDAKGCIVNRVFGCNNLNGTPKGKAQVYVYATQSSGSVKTTISDKYAKHSGMAPENDTTPYDVAAVYGGGNLSPYVPADALLDYSVDANKARVEAARSEVYIDGCSLTSIKQVYGGGNAAAASGTFVQVNRCYEIEEVFGGGNGYNPYTLNNETYQNPGANVGYYNYTHFVKNTTTNEYEPVENTDGDTKDERIENYRYGSGIATTEIKGGKIHVVYGGSNKKGNISTMALSMYSGMFSDCPMDVDQSYGGGKDADIDGEVVVQLNCAKGIREMFGGSKNADVDNDIHLRVTNGSSLDRVFGGNNTSGAINGSITVDIEEGGCEPVIIKELYAGGYLAPYSVYGYEKNDDDTYKIKEGATDEEGNAIQERIPLTSGDNPKKDPRINVISATRIDNIYGGGYKAKVVGNPHINVNMKPGRVDVDKVEKPEGSGTYVYEDIDGHEYSADNVETVEISGKTKYYGILPLGTVGNIYGGGNEADIVGNTYVEIGTGMWLNGDDVWETADAQGNKYTYKKDASNKWHWYNASDAVVTAPTPARKAAVMRSDTRNNVVYEGGNVYGGGNKGDVTGNTYVNICAYEEDDASTTDVIEYKGVPLSGTGNEIVTIAGNVFGGGKGIADSFTCAKGMVGEVDSNNGDIVITKESINKGTRVSIGNGTIGGSVYGGGEVGRVEWNGVVTIGLPVGDNETSAPVIQGDVFGGGKGVEQYGYAALLRGNTFVTVQANAKVGKSVYGGGEIASVGRYYIKKRTDDPTYDPNAPAAPNWLDYGMPYSLANQGSGYCNVIVTGNAEIGPDNMKMYNTETGKPDDEGHVFGAGKGVLPYENEDDFECQKEGHNKGKHPGRMGPGNVWDCYDGKEADYLTFIETQALATQTEVLVDGNAFVKGSVYGGSLSGHVQHNTHVTIDGDCQIGVGYDTSTGEYQPKYTNWPTETQGITESWAECAHWTYDATDDAPYDPYALYEIDGKYYYDEHPENYYKDDENNYYFDEQHTQPIYANGGSSIAKDGHTYYGNVFGGGSGVVPYKPGKWHREAGTVGGNTVVDITGGHILTSVYGGNEHTDVGTYDRSANNRTLQANTGKCTVNMIGGTVGVPRTKADILAHPVTCSVYGGGKGDSRTNFNTWTNVGETEVNISGNARIYGSTFGGGEDGHVLGDAETNIGGTVTIGGTVHDYPTNAQNPGVIIGTQGLSGADGNVFGGGRGFSENALTAGVVSGNVTLNIKNGKMLGTVYGGGRLASVGAHLAAEGTANYGKLIPDGYNQVIGSTDVEATDATHGHIAINIDGGTIGATSNGQLVASDYSVGDVFGGSKGAGSNTSFGLAKYTTITMKGGTVNGNVYGGGELGNVNDNTEVDIQGGTIGKNVFGGGKGSKIFFTCEQAMVGEVDEGVDISGEGESATYTLRPGGTTVKITKEGRVKGNVYGGGEIGRVERNTVVTIGTLGGEDIPIVEGNVFGAGAGLDTHGYSALVRGTSTVTVQGSAQVWKNVYGGGEKASLGRYWVATTPALATEHHVKQGMPYGLKAGGKGTVVIQDNAVIGTDNDNKTGHVYGAGQGIEPRNYDYASQTQGDNKPGRMVMGNGWEYFDSETDYLQFIETLAISAETDVTIKGSAEIKGSVFGGSESGFVYHDTNVKIQNGTINGSAFGGGRGLDSFAEAGRVSWNTKLTMSNGTVKGNVYGGGNLGDVGTIDKTDKKDGKLTYNYKWKQKDGKTANVAENNVPSGSTHDTSNNTGICTVTITGGTIGSSSGVTANHESGHVFGAGQGLEDTWWCEKAIAYATNVSVSGSTVVYGNVYGGGQVGRVEDDGQVTIGETTDTGEGSKPDIKGDVYGAGAGLETHGYSALLRGNAKVTVQRIAKVGGSVYGGGETASVGRFVVVGGLPTKPETGGTCIVNIKDNAQIGESGTGHNVYGACKGVTPHYNSSNYKSVYSMQTYENRPSDTPGDTWDYYVTYGDGFTGQKFIKRYYKTEADYLDFLKTLALTSNPHVTIGGTWTPNETTGTITASGTPTVYGSVYGGGQRGVTLGSVDVNMVGGTVEQDVYGGGALADTNLGNWDVNGYVEATGIALGAPVTGLYTRTESNGKFTYTKITAEDAVAVSGTTYYRQEATWAHNEGSAYYTTSVDMTGGTIKGNAYGGGLGQKAKAAVGTQPAVPAVAALVYGDVLVELNKTTTTDNCVVQGVIHGANNYNGSPQGDVTVHVYKTQGWTDDKGTDSPADDVSHDVTTQKATNATRTNMTYELKAVYGGGNEAAYDPKDPNTRKAHVIIDGCDLTSIETVYGGGNAASTPATHVEVNECYEIGTVFGGGNGKDEMDDHTPNPGADVGLIALKTGGTAYSGDPTKQAYGTGVALAELRGGTIHKAFGGSNTKGNIRTSAKVDLNEPTPVTCPLCIEEVYGAGNEADQDGTSTIDLGCLSYLSEIYGGAKDADVNNKIELTIQSGRFDRVFGGNNIGGKISGTITVNIEETGCHPIVIGQLFGGGNQAAYTAPAKQHGPTVNVKSFTSIGEIYGGGFGASAVVKGDTYVNINEGVGKHATTDITADWKDQNGDVVDTSVKVSANTSKWIHFVAGKRIEKNESDEDVEVDVINTVWQPEHKSGAIGTIGNVFGGGNEAGVDGSTNVIIGTTKYEEITSAVAGKTDVRGFFTRSGAGTSDSPYDYTEVPTSSVVAVANTTYYSRSGDTYVAVASDNITVGETNVSSYYVRSGAGTTASPFVYTPVPVPAVANTKYYMPVIGVNITGNVYGGGNAADVSGDTNVLIGK